MPDAGSHSVSVARADAPQPDRAAFLRGVSFFRNLPDSALRAIESACEECGYAAGEVIFREHARAERFFIILDGSVEIWKDHATPQPDLLGVQGAGELFGEMALIDDLPRSATVVARTPTAVLCLDRASFDRILQEHPTVAISILRSLSATVRMSNQSYVEDLRRQNQALEAAYEELKSTQQELLVAERFSDLGKFASMILHDIRNPISVVQGYAEMLQCFAQKPEQVTQYADSIVRESERLNRIANELLDYSRGEIRLDVSSVDLDDLLEHVGANLASGLAERGIDLRIDNRVETAVAMDRERILRVLVNLSDNSRKAMRDGGQLTLSAEQKGAVARIRVADTGEGMPAEVLERLFEPFYSSSSDGGTGLGMVIVKNVVEAHGGELDVQSTQGVGTTISITLPLEAATTRD